MRYISRPSEVFKWLLGVGSHKRGYLPSIPNYLQSSVCALCLACQGLNTQHAAPEIGPAAGLAILLITVDVAIINAFVHISPQPVLGPILYEGMFSKYFVQFTQQL